jgi:hypothetical protein
MAQIDNGAPPPKVQYRIVDLHSSVTIDTGHGKQENPPDSEVHDVV